MLYSVSELNRESKRILAEHFLQIQVEGELSNLSTPASGHIYFTLKDAGAQVRCAMFRMHQRKIHFKPTNGQLVIVTAQVGLYEPRGDYQLIVENMEQAGAGALRAAFDKLKTKLQAEGLFEQSRKKNLPLLPDKIGIISSPTGAAIHDMLTVLKRRFPAVSVILYPVAVQGDNAKTDIANAIATANQRQEVDILIIGRGGGSLEDLWAFNEEKVARAIANSTIPVISAVGHEIDFSIADFVADLRAATPSAAAEHAVPDHQEWLGIFAAYESRLQQIMLQYLQKQQQTLDWVLRSLQQQHPGQKLQQNQQRLQTLAERLQRSLLQALAQKQTRLNSHLNELRRNSPTISIEKQKQHLLFFEQRLQRTMTNKIALLKRKQAGIAHTLHAVSPLATLERGYAIVTSPENGSGVIKSSDQIEQGNIVQTRLGKGRFLSEIKDIFHD